MEINKSASTDLKNGLKNRKKILPVFFLIIFLFVVLFAKYSVKNVKQTVTIPPVNNTSDNIDHISPKSGPVPGQLLVKFKKDLSDEVINSHLKPFNSKILNKITGINVTVVEVPAGQEEEIRSKLLKDTIVLYSERNYYVHVNLIPNDTDFNKQWGLLNTGGVVVNPKNQKSQQGTANADIHITKAWDVTKGGGVKVGIVDTGIDVTHPDLAGRIAETTFLYTSNIDDKFGHGTHVAGIIAANTNNSQGIAGVCPECQLYIVKAVDDNGNGDMAVIAQGIIWTADKGVKVVNISAGGKDSTETITAAVKYAQDKGAVVVAAVGNDSSSNLYYPAAVAGVVSVAATDNNDKLASFSNYGSWVQIAAPGFAIYSTLPHGNVPGLRSAYPNITQTYGSLNGTSMAAPFVSGVAGLIFSTQYGTSTDAVIKRLCDTADKIESTGTNWICGRVNAEAAVNGGVSSSGQPSTAPPVGGVPSPACLGNCPTQIPSPASPTIQTIMPSQTIEGGPTNQLPPANNHTTSNALQNNLQPSIGQTGEIINNRQINNGGNEGLLGFLINFLELILRLIMSLLGFGR